MERINLDQLHGFATAIELGSFSAAAQRLDLTQPAVSLQVRQLEKRLGTPLVERVGRVLRPTAAGAELLVHVARIDAAVADALHAVAHHASGTAGRVRLGTGATACIFLLPPVLGALRQRFAGLEITVRTGNTADIVQAVEDNTLDVGLVTLPASGRMLDVTPVLQDPFVAIAPKGTALPKKVTAADLARHPVLLFEPGGQTRRIADAWFARAGVALQPAMSLGSVEAIKELVAAGLGCAVLPGMAVQGTHGSAVEVRPLSPPLARTLAVVVRKDKRLHRGLRETVAALKALGHTGSQQREALKAARR
ncbi:LysR family transcriptional regulator [Acidovorax sp. Root219]|uniref:LysR family transcriptional regulator n=1 Tax=Acidovorax sp. Root219 TaxID=1736493 RepID=UPI00070A3540|nr:LysR family transcriptional regulator [Acidovorax sp. Root219]KRC16560.1 LysR family transcriptional regulator [Acidovorax sp. Root219]